MAAGELIFPKEETLNWLGQEIIFVMGCQMPARVAMLWQDKKTRPSIEASAQGSLA
jgi:hypothetical protein